MRWLAVVLSLALLVASSSRATAQVAWEAPRLLGPTAPVEPGAAWVRFGGSGGGQGVVGTWRPSGLPEPLSLRGGLARDADDDPAGLVGVDVRAPLLRRDDGARADVTWSTGAGVVVGEFVRVSVPVDLLLGRAWSSGSVWLAPYLTAGVVMDLDLGDEAPGREFHLRPTAGAGLDLALDPGRRVVLRAGASFGDHEALAVGVLVRPGG